MRLAVISDIHGNLEAFTAVLEELAQVRPDGIISLGDNIGYGPDSEAVMELVAAHGVESILGNHEMVVKTPKSIRWFNPMARKALDYTLGELSASSVEAIRAYPQVLVRENMRFVHGAPPRSPFVYLFQFEEERLAEKMAGLREWICFAGHTHDLGVTVWDGREVTTHSLAQGTLELDPGKKYLINAGSVGQPRDGTPDAKYMVIDTETRVLAVRYLPYSYEKTQKKIIAAGIPRMFADKLAMRFKPDR